MTAKTLEQEVQTIGPGTYAKLVPQLKVWHTISQIQTARKRKSGEGLRNIWFYGGDGCVYGLKGSDVFLYLTDADNNPGRKDPEQFASELINNHNFFLDPKKSSTLEAKANDPKDNSVVAINLSQLEREERLTKYDDEFSGIEVETEILKNGREAFLEKYGGTRTKLFDRVEGKAIYGEEGIGDLLLEEGKNLKIIGVLTPKYVKDALKGKTKGTMLARASYVYYFDVDSDVNLGYRVLDNGSARLRGVVDKKAAEGGDARKIMTYKAALRKANEIAPRGTPFNQIMVGFVNTIYGK